MNGSLTVIPLEVIRDNLTKYLCDKSCVRLSLTCKTYHELYQNSNFAQRLWEVFFRKKWPRIEPDSKYDAPPACQNIWINRYNYQTSQDVQIRCQLMDFHSRYLLSSSKNISVLREMWVSFIKKGDLILDVVCDMLQNASTNEAIFLNHVLEAVSKGSVLYRIIGKSFQEINQWPIEKLPIMLAKCFDWESFVHRSSSSINSEDYIEHELNSLANHVKIHLKQHYKENPDGRFPTFSILEAMKTIFSTQEINSDLHSLACQFPSRWSFTGDTPFNLITPFHGNTIDYYATSNSMIHKVLYFKTGIPITLSIIYSSIVKRATGVDIEPIGLPGHFLLSTTISNEITGQIDRVFIDAFDGGSILNKEKVQQMILPFGVAWDDAFLKPISNIDICHRMIRNLSNCRDLRLAEKHCVEAFSVYLYVGAVNDIVESDLILLMSSKFSKQFIKEE